MTPDAAATQPLRPARAWDDHSDEALALAARKGDARAFGALVERHQGRLTAFLRRRTLIHEDAVDLAQEAFVRAWTNLDRFDAGRSFRVWLFTIAARLSADLARSASRRAERERAIHAMGKPAGPGAGERAEQREAASRIWRLADETLSEQQRSILWLRYAEDLSVEQIARALGKSNVAVRVNLHRARAALRKRLEREERPERAAATQPPSAQRRPESQSIAQSATGRALRAGASLALEEIKS